jgi:tryptophanyl-tRNA synthetase
LIQEAGARIMGLDDPTAKMSKSVAATRPEHALLLLDPPDVIHKKLSRAKTDSKPAVEFPAGPGVTNLLEIYRTLHDLNREAVEEEFAGKPYSALKAAVAESVVEAVRPLQQRYRELRADPAMLSRRLERSLEHVAPLAELKLGQVRKAVGLEATRRRSPSQ